MIAEGGGRSRNRAPLHPVPPGNPPATGDLPEPHRLREAPGCLGGAGLHFPSTRPGAAPVAAGEVEGSPTANRAPSAANASASRASGSTPRALVGAHRRESSAPRGVPRPRLASSSSRAAPNAALWVPPPPTATESPPGSQSRPHFSRASTAARATKRAAVARMSSRERRPASESTVSIQASPKVSRPVLLGGFARRNG